MYPKITIVTATLNREAFLKKCLKSVEIQTYKNIEHIFVEGYSTDNTVKLIKQYIERNPDIETKFIQAKPKGVANAINIGLKQATGDVVHFLHDDDYYINSTSLKRAAKYFRNDKNLEWLVGNFGIERKNKQITFNIYNINKHPKLTKFLATVKTFLPHENTFCSKSFYDKYGPFEEKNKVAVEYKIWLRALIETHPTPADEVFTIYINHKGSITSNPYNYFVLGIKEGLRSMSELKYLPVFGYYGSNTIYKKLKRIK